MRKKIKFLSAVIIISMMGLPVFCGAEEIDCSGLSDKMFPASLSSVTMESENSRINSLEVFSPISSLHKWLGYTTVTLSMLTGVLNPENVGINIHQTLGYMTAGFAFATMTAGFFAHYGDIDLQSGWSSNNIHILLGITGGAMMMTAPLIAPGEVHQVFGELGTLTMGISIVGKLVY